jgi:hypothetical protein
MNPLETYFTDLAEIRSSGATVKETSGYGPLANLLNAIGDTLKPKVRCLIQLKNSGAGMPDGGFFTPDQLKNKDEDAPLLGHPQPARGVIEVKGTKEEIEGIVKSQQVKDYLAHYGQVLVTNYRDFILLQRHPAGGVLELESFRLAENEAAFWASTSHPHKAVTALGERLAEYLKRILLYAAPLNNPRDVAFFLASYARDARARVEIAGDLPALTAVRTALEEALGMKFEEEKGEHFFRSTLVQTLFYGVFSAWVLWHKEKPLRADRFEWKDAAWTLHVPMIKVLFEQVATPSKLGPLKLVEVLDWTEAALNRVDRPAFFKNFVESHAVQYFYEPFLEAFDPELRKDLGVWYTPPEIVEYMVARVDTVLREELGIADGLADPRVVVLDPCCGTGAYLVEVLKRINRTLNEEQGLGQMAQLYTKKAAQERIFGFELLPAPFVVAHLQLGLLLQNFGVPLDDGKSERAAIYLTNALNGWEPPKEPKQHLLFEEFQQERDAADRVKQQAPIIVILGNPPYNGFAGLAVEEERDLSNAYRTTKKAPPPRGQGLNDLYVRFFRMAERRIIEKSGEGVVCFISNYSWLDGLSFTGMRERYLEVFDSITIDCLNGDKYKTGKLAPDGKPDPSIFSTETNREGIQVGTAIAMLVRKPKHKQGNQVQFRHLWGKEKHAELLKSLGESSANLYEALQPPLEVGLPFLPAKVELDFFAWPLLPDLFPTSFPGVKTSRDDFLIAVDKKALEERLGKYFDPGISHEQMRAIAPGIMEDSARFDSKAVRAELLQTGFLKDNIVRYSYRPFDVRWLYWEPVTKLLDEKRPEYFPQIFESNLWLEARQKQTMDVFDRGYFSRVLSDNFGNGLSNYFPLLLKSTHDGDSLFGGSVDDIPESNLSDGAKKYLRSLKSEKSPELLFFHILAVLHAPIYRAENSGALRQDWPRIPLPESRDILVVSADLGRRVAALLDTEKPVPGVTQGKPNQDLKGIAELHWSGDPDFKITAGWGHPGKGGVTMPGRGKLVERTDSAKAFPAILGKKTYDVYLNDTACWQNMPERVWEYTIGGYQVIKKWLSYREYDLLGRALTPDEAREVTNMARRIADLILLHPELDKNYEAVKSAPASWNQFTTK